SQEAPANLAAPKHEAPAKESSPEPQPIPAKPITESVERLEHRAEVSKPGEQTADLKENAEEKDGDLRSASAASSAAERQEPGQTPAPSDQPSVVGRERTSSPDARTFYPPPFTHRSESESPAVKAEKTSSAFLNKPEPAPSTQPAPTQAEST